MNKSYAYLIISFSFMIAGYSSGDTISDDDLNFPFSICFPDDSEDIQFGDYKYTSVIWLNLSASW